MNTTTTKTQDLKIGDKIEAYGMEWEVTSILWGEIMTKDSNGNTLGFTGFSFNKITK